MPTAEPDAAGNPGLSRPSPKRPTLRYCAMAPGDMEGWLFLEHTRGGLLRARRPRYLRLQASRLDCARGPAGPCLWALSVRDAPVSLGARPGEIVVGCPPGSGRKGVSLFGANEKEREMWLFSLRKASLMSTRVEDYYRIGPLIGEGMNGQVREAHDVVTGEKVAVKMVPRLGREHEDDFLAREVQIVLSLEHQNIVRVLDVFVRKRRIYFVMEHLSGGELFDYVSDCRIFSENRAKIVVADLLAGLVYLHDRGVVHRDIKLENLLTTDDKWPFSIKIADFGFSNFIPDPAPGIDRDAALTSFVGTPYFLAPELLSSNGHGRPVDLWATGVTLYILLSGKFPFGGASEKDYYARVLHKQAYFPSPEWDNISEPAKHLLRGLLTKDPTQRLTARLALRHPWFDDLDHAHLAAAAETGTASAAFIPPATVAPPAFSPPTSTTRRTGSIGALRKRSVGAFIPASMRDAKAPLPTEPATSSSDYAREDTSPGLEIDCPDTAARRSSRDHVSSQLEAAAAAADMPLPASSSATRRRRLIPSFPSALLSGVSAEAAETPKSIGATERFGGHRRPAPDALGADQISSFPSSPLGVNGDRSSSELHVGATDAARLDRLAGQTSSSSSPAVSTARPVPRSTSKSRIRAIGWSRQRSVGGRRAKKTTNGGGYNNTNVATYVPATLRDSSNPTPTRCAVSSNVGDGDDDSCRALDHAFNATRSQSPAPSPPSSPSSPDIDPASPSAAVAETPGLTMLTCAAVENTQVNDGHGVAAAVKEDDMSLRGIHADRPEKNMLAGTSATWGTSSDNTFFPGIARDPSGADGPYSPSLMTAVKGEDKMWGSTCASRVSSINSSPDTASARYSLTSPSPPASTRGARVKRRHSAIRQILSAERLSLDSRLPPGLSKYTEPDDAFSAHERNVGGPEHDVAVREYGSAGTGVQAGPPVAEADVGKLSRFAFRSFHRTSVDEQTRGRSSLFTASGEKLPPKVARQQKQQLAEGLASAKRSKGSWFSTKFRRSTSKASPRIPLSETQASPGIATLPSHFSPAIGPDGPLPVSTRGNLDVQGAQASPHMDFLVSTGATSSQMGFVFETSASPLVCEGALSTRRPNSLRCRSESPGVQPGTID